MVSPFLFRITFYSQEALDNFCARSHSNLFLFLWINDNQVEWFTASRVQQASKNVLSVRKIAAATTTTSFPLWGPCRYFVFSLFSLIFFVFCLRREDKAAAADCSQCWWVKPSTYFQSEKYSSIKKREEEKRRGDYIPLIILLWWQTVIVALVFSISPTMWSDQVLRIMIVRRSNKVSKYYYVHSWT